MILKHRSAAAVFWLPIITFGIYSLVWCAKTRGDMQRNGTTPMSTWWLLIPFASFWYFWSLAKAIQTVTGKSAGTSYVVLILLGNIGEAIVQARINGTTVTSVAAPAVA